MYILKSVSQVYVFILPLINPKNWNYTSQGIATYTGENNNEKRALNHLLNFSQWQKPEEAPYPSTTNANGEVPCRHLTFGDAECVITTCYKIIKCNKEIRVTLSGSEQVLLRAPPDGFVQCLGFNITTIGAMQSF